MPQSHPILLPAIALVLWTILMCFWMVAARVRAFRAARIDLKANVGGLGRDLDGRLPGPALWPGHNYNHLHEQPTLFYALILAMAVGALWTTTDVWLAWAYVALRVAHSLYQALVNVVAVRARIFVLATLVLLVLAVRAALALLAG
ncbi:MAG: MAPEG family protein [Sphingomonadaceae bacterium]